MEVAIERPPVKEEKMSHEKPEEITAIGSALPIVFESFQSVERSGSSKQQDESSLDAAKAEMGVVRQENERLKSMLSRVVSEYQSLQTHFLDVVKQGREQQANKPLPPEEATAAAPPPVADDADDLVSLSLGTRTNNNGDGRKKGGHERSSSSSGTAGDDSQLSLGLGFTRPSTTTDDEKAGPVLNLSSDSSGSADDTAKQHAGESRKSPSGGGGDDEVQQQAKKTRVSVRVKCDTPTMNDGCQWRKYGQKISKGNPCPRAYYRCTVAPNCPVRKQVQRCAEDRSILITTYEGAHSHPLPPAATAMASTTSAAAAMLTTGSTTSSSLLARHHIPGLLGPAAMVSTAASCPTITLDLTSSSPAAGAAGIMHASSPYAYDSTKALPAAWTSGYPALYGAGSHLQSSSYFAAKTNTPAMMGHLFAGLQRPDQLYGLQGQPSSSSSFLQRTASLGQAAPVVTDTLAKAITSDPGFQSVLAAVITSYMGRGGQGEPAQNHK